MKTYFVVITLTLMLLLVSQVFVVSAQGISADELQIYYSFDEDTFKDGDVLDLSGNENHGLLRGVSLETVEGKVAEGLQFPGVASDYISVRNLHYADLFPEISIAVWIKTAVRGMIASWDRSEFFRFAAGDDQLGNLTFVGFDVCCPISDWHGDVEVTDNNWHHIVVTFNSEMKRIYVDGELDVEAPTDTNENKIGKLVTRYGFIGIGSEAAAFNANVGPNWAFNGIMDEFLLFHRAISADEAEKLYNAEGSPLSVEPTAKLSLTWGQIKNTK